MACPGEGILTDLTRRLVDKSIKEVNYFRHFETHDREFTQDQELLIRKLEKVQKDIEDAKRYNQYQIEGEVQDWIEDADNLIQKKAEMRSTRFDSWCPLRQYRQGKRFAQRALTIKDHIKKCNFEIVARPAELRDMKYHASRDFIDLESRKTKFKQLVEAFEDGNHHIIGLQGMGGTGKTTLATQVGKQLEESKAFEKVIFVVLSNPPNVNKIRGDIARQLGLRLEESKEADHSKLLWSRIFSSEKKLLIILDDVWGELNLIDIGIPFGRDHSNCYVLITTRHSKVCQVMRCQQIVRLHTLVDEDAFHLFLFHATSDDDDDDSSRNELEGLAREFLKECGGLPVAIVALASTLRNWHVGELNAALTALQNAKPFVDVDEDLVQVYNCLRLSYDYLHNEKAQKLFLLCSIFPEDYEFPVNLVDRLGIGAGIFEEADDYCAARIQALAARKKLIDSSLLQKVGEKECVKMHDLIREVAQWIAQEDIQVIKDSRITLKTNKRFVFWSTDDFPDQLDDTNLEILLLCISGNARVKDPNAFFAGMSRLKILFLLGEYGRKVPSPSLSKSLLSLKDIHTLILDGWELGDISILKNVQSLVTLEFKNCLIIELPRNIRELKRLRWLGMRNCEIQKSNPFEVIEKCSQLEEVYFVENFNVGDWTTKDEKEIEDEIAQDLSSLELHIFSISYDGFERFSSDDNGLLRCFNPNLIRHLIPNALFKYLVRSAEVLELGKIGQTAWKNLAPDIIPLENGGMDNLIKLYLYEWEDFECLIDNSKYHYSNTTFFSKLVELHLYGVDVKKFYWGAMPSRFLLQLQILKLEKCMRLQNIFFDENINLPHLKVLRLICCPMFQPSIFSTSVAQSLERLEELVVEDCGELKSLIAYESLKQEMIVVGSRKKYGLLFPVLKSLRIRRCVKLEIVFSLLLPGDIPKLKDLSIGDCKELKYIFGEYRVLGQVLQQEIVLPLLTEVTLAGVPCFISICQNCLNCVLRPPQVCKEDSKEKHENSKVFSWAYGCCFLAPTKDTNIGLPNATMEHHIISQGSCGSRKRMETMNTTECLMRHPLSLQNIRQMTLFKCSKLKSLFSVSIATTIMLVTLLINGCDELKDIITNEAEDDDHLNCTSIFPKLQSLRVFNCNKLKFIFPSTLSGGLQKLKSIETFGGHELKYVFGKYIEKECVSNEIENNEPHIHLPALETLSLRSVPNMISIGLKNNPQNFPSIQIVEAAEGSCASRNKRKIETFHTTECLVRHPLNIQNIRAMTLWGCSKLMSLFRVSIARTMIMLEKLDILECEELKHIITNEAEDGLNCSSIFPKLQSLRVFNCNKLEFIFPSTLAGGLQKLKSIETFEDHELKYVFGKYNEEECVLNENENNEPHIDLPALETLSLRRVPNMISIGVKKNQQNCPSIQIVEAPEGSCASRNKKKIETFHTTECLLRHPLNVQNIREMTLWGCSKLKSLFSVSIATTLITLEKLDILECEELKHIITNEAEDGVNCSSIFPKLQSLRVFNCNKLEYIFPSTLAGGLQKLKSIEAFANHELKYVFGKYNEEECVLSENENNEPHIDLRALETLSLGRVPNMISIGVKNNQQNCPSIQIVEGPEGSRASSNKKKIETFYTIECLMRQPLSLHNIREMSLGGCSKLKSFFSVSIATTMIKLEKLEIWKCVELKHIITNEVEDDDHLNYTSIFPNLQSLDVSSCNKLEFIFPYTLSGGLQKLKSIDIIEAYELKYVFGKYNEEGCILNESENDQLQIHLPALEALSLQNVPMMINICAKEYYLSFPSLKSIKLEDLQEFDGRSFQKDLMKIIKDEQKLTELRIRDSKIEESKKEIVREIEAKHLTPALLEKQALEGSTTKPQLRNTSLHNYKETEKEDGRIVPDPISKLPAPTSSSFQSIDITLKERSEQGPALEDVVVVDLKPRNSSAYKGTEKEVGNRIPASSLPATTSPDFESCIESIPKDTTIAQVASLTEKHEQGSQGDDATRKAAIAIHSTDSESMKQTRLSSIIAHSRKDIGAEDPTPALLEKQAMEGSTTKPQLRSTSLHNFKETEKEGGRVVPDPASKLPAPTSSSFQNYKEIEKEGGRVVPDTTASKLPALASSSFQIMEETLIEIQAKDPDRASGKQASETSAAKSHLRRTSGPEMEVEHKISESIMQLQQKGLLETKTTDASHRTNMPCHDNSIDAILKERAEEGSTSEDVVAATMVADLAPRKSWDLMPSKSRSEMSMAHSLELAPDMMIVSDTSSVVSQVEGSKSGPSTLASLSSKKTEKEAIRIQTSQLSIDPTWTNLEITQRIKDTKEHGHEENYAKEYSYSRKQSIGPIDNLPRKDSAPTIKETGDHSSIQEEEESEKPIKAPLPQVMIPSVHYQSQAGAAGSSTPILEIGEIFQLVELKDGEPAILAKALELYPQLRLSRGQRTQPIIAFSYRVLVDILVMLASRTPYTLTALDRTTLEANLGAATFLGFDEDWIESVWAKVFGIDKSNILVVEEKISVMEEKLEKCDIALERMQKKRMETREKLAIVQNKLAIVQNEFEAVDTQLFDLLENRRNLVIKMIEFRKITSVKDRPFGI